MDTIGKLIWFKVPCNRLSRAAHAALPEPTITLPAVPSWRSAYSQVILALYPKGGKTWAVKESTKKVVDAAGNVTQAGRDCYTLLRKDGASAEQIGTITTYDDGSLQGKYNPGVYDAQEVIDGLNSTLLAGARELRETTANSALAQAFIDHAQTHYDCVFLTGRGIFVPRETLHSTAWRALLDQYASFCGWDVKSLPLVDEDEANRAVASLIANTFAGQYMTIMRQIDGLQKDGAIMKQMGMATALLDKAKRLGQTLRVQLDEEILSLAQSIETAGTLNDIASIGCDVVA